jgi:hypothetical protein
MKCDCGVESLDESHLNWCCLLQDDSIWDFSPKPTLKEMADRADRLYWKPQRKNAERRIKAKVTTPKQPEVWRYTIRWNHLLSDVARVKEEIKKRTQ